MSHGAPLQYLWWLVSRASGILALVLVSLSVVLGLAMAARVIRRPGLKRTAVSLHEHLAITALLAIAVHGAALLGDHWLKPGWRGITIPFALSYRPAFTGAGIIAGYLAVLTGPTFYARRRIGARRWRRLHRATGFVWLLGAVHTLGAGSDTPAAWLRMIVLMPVPAIAYLVVQRFAAGPASRRPATAGLRSGHGVDLAVRARDGCARDDRPRHGGPSGGVGLRPVCPVEEG